MFLFAWDHGGMKRGRGDKLPRSVHSLWKNGRNTLGLFSLSVLRFCQYIMLGSHPTGEKDNFSLGCRLVNTHCPQLYWGRRENKKSHTKHSETNTKMKVMCESYGAADGRVRLVWWRGQDEVPKAWSIPGLLNGLRENEQVGLQWDWAGWVGSAWKCWQWTSAPWLLLERVLGSESQG